MAKSFQATESDRGIFDENLPLQGIFDSIIFDTQLAPATVTHILLPIFVHDTSQRTALLHSTELITVK